ncbi:unnamed protein product [Larinioides sclopetarius]|uniref:Uncharacterized protein n=1 Tax=Larinioides sclopetarius TaxID=280406 RepID=A0AAV2BN51_9ARAC
MEKSDKDHEVSRNSDDSMRNILEGEHECLAEYCGDFCTTDAISERNDLNMCLEGDQMLHDKNEVVKKTAEDFKKISAASRKCERSNNISTDNNKLVSDLHINSVQKENRKEKPQKRKMPFSNIASAQSCRMSHFLCKSRKTSETASRLKSKNIESSRRSAATTITPISGTMTSDENPKVYKCDTDKDASLECNSQTLLPAVVSSDNSSNIPSSNMRIPKKDSQTSAEMFAEEPRRKIRSTLNHQNLSSSDSMNCNSDTSSNPTNYPRCSTEMSAMDEDRNHPQSALKYSRDVNNVLLHTISDSNSVTHEDLKTSDRNSKSLNPDSSISNRESKICHPNLKFLLIDQDLMSNKKSSDENEKALRNVLKKYFKVEDIHQVTVEKFSDLRNILVSDDGMVINLDTETENKVSFNFKNTDDDYDHLKASICPEDRNKALQNYPSGNSIQSKAKTFSSNYSEYYQSDLKFSDSDSESYHSELMFSDSDNESNRSNELCHIAKEFRSILNSAFEFQDIKQEKDITAEAFSNRKLTSDNDGEVSYSSHETKEMGDSGNTMNNDDECEKIKSVVDSEDPYLALEIYFSSTNSLPSKAIKMPNNASECGHSDLTSSDSNQDPKHDKRSSDESNVPITFQNLLNSFIESSIRGQKDITPGEFTSETDQISFVNAYEENENSIDTDDEAERLDELICSDDPETALENYFSNRNSNPSKSSSDDPSEFHRSYSVSSDNSTERLDLLKLYQGLKNVTNDSASFQGFIQKQDIDDKELTLMDLASDNYKVTPERSSNKMKNDATAPSERLHSFYRSQGMESTTKSFFSGGKSFFEIHSHFSKENSKTHQSGLKISNRDQKPLRFKQPKTSNDDEVLKKQQSRNVSKREKNVRNSALDSGRSTPIGCVGITDNDSNDVLDIFKKVIKYHPIKKFEIPPYESANSEKSLEKLDDRNSHTMELYGSNEHRNILECFFNTDSSSIMAFDVTDCFSQNSSIICDGLLREYLDISAKVNLLLVKQRRKISDEEYELRINILRSLDDELGYVSAKLMTTINDWVKQFNEIDENVAQSRIGSRCLYHMEILRICVYLISVLLKFTLEKQLELENHEHFLIFHHNRSN